MANSSGPPDVLRSAAEEIARSRAAEELLRDELAELHDAQLLLEESRDDYAALYDIAPLAQLTLSGGTIIRTANSAAAELLELERNALIGRAFRSFVASADRARIGKLGSTSELAQPTEVRLMLASGVLVPVQVWTRICGGRSGAVHLGLVDMRSGQRDAWQQEQLVASERSARLASDSKDQFIAMLSHELRTPLTPILAAASRWEQATSISEEVRGVFQMIRRNAMAETRLVDDLLDVTGILRGKMRVVRKPLDVHPLLEECLAALKADAEASNVKLLYSPEAEQSIVSADALRLRQVFTNLLKNALKATPSNGAITVHTWSSGSRVAVEVLDTGMGFEQHEVSRLFDAFDQLDRGAESSGGLGLGLAISKGLVELHDGTLNGMSPGRGRGARFVVELPTTYEPELGSSPRAAPIVSAPSTIVRPCHLLLVEDHEDTAEVMKSILEDQGYAVTWARCIAEAVAVDLRNVDLILSDLGLPDGSGHDLLGKLDSAAKPPAIVLSGRGMQSDIDASKRAGFDLHLVKPIDIGLLLKSVRELLTYRSEAFRAGRAGADQAAR